MSQDNKDEYQEYLANVHGKLTTPDEVITEKLRGVEIKFRTKSGVFSKQGIDSGSKLLIDNMEIADGTLVADLGCGTGVVGFIFL